MTHYEYLEELSKLTRRFNHEQKADIGIKLYGVGNDFVKSVREEINDICSKMLEHPISAGDDELTHYSGFVLYGVSIIIPEDK